MKVQAAVVQIDCSDHGFFVIGHKAFGMEKTGFKLENIDPRPLCILSKSMINRTSCRISSRKMIKVLLKTKRLSFLTVFKENFF